LVLGIPPLARGFTAAAKTATPIARPTRGLANSQMLENKKGGAGICPHHLLVLPII